MIRTPRARRLLHRTALATCLSAGVLALVGCVDQPVNTNARNADPTLHGSDAEQRDWEKQQKDPAITVETFYAAAQLAESQELWDRAVAEYDKALKINKDHLPSLYRLGVIYAKFKQYPQAIVIWKHYLAASGGDPTAYANIGFCYELGGNFEEAQDAYESGIRRDPNSAPCRVNYGLMLARRGRFNQAMHQWQVVLPPAEVYYNMGSAYEAMDRKEQAKADFHKALELDPQLADARARLERLGDKVLPPPPAVAQAPGAPEAAAAPTTAPSEAPVATVPETKPVEEAAVPTTAPSAGSEQAPSTQPVALTDTPTTAPSTQPTVSTAAPTTAPVTDSSVGDRPEVDITDPPAHN
jgi:tetratricopeptide (TPR) repeat protein